MRPHHLPLLALLALPACTRPLRPSQARPAALRDPVAMLVTPDRARWVPENADGAMLLRQLPDGTKQYLLQRLRVEQSPNGALRRATDLLPSSRTPITTEALPDRLGGGHIFTTTGTSTSIWRSSHFLGRLTSLARLPVSAAQVVPGTDRLLVRMVTGDRVWGVDPVTGALGAPLPLPTAPRYGMMAFVDAWRGAVFGDLLGLMTTHDAGVTWQKIPLEEPPHAFTVEPDSGVITVALSNNKKLYVDPSVGQISPEGPNRPPPPTETPPKRLWGATAPLRVALEDGWPLLDGTAVVFRGGRVVRVKLDDGETLASSFSPVEGEEATTCAPIRFGADVGFACGASGQGTSLYTYAPPTDVSPVVTFRAPRRVVPSQNGWLVIHGSCDLEASGDPQEGLGTYCVISPTGGRREVLTRGDTGVERVVALADGRVAVIVPPRGATDGLVTLLPAQNGGAVATVRIQPGDDAALLRRGLWLDGMYEVSPGELGGWIEASGLLLGVRIKLTEESVLVGQPQDGAQFSVAGPVAMAALGTDQLHESLDGGLNWKPVDMPVALGQGKLRAGLRCGVAGCVVPFERGTWLRVGWGQSADPTDLEDALEAATITPLRPSHRPLRLECEQVSQEEVKDVDVPRQSSPRRRFPIAMPIPPEEPGNNLLPSFFGVLPPQTPAGALALSEGTASGNNARLYGWVPRGVAAGRAGRLQVRFQDRFSPEHPVRSSALTIAAWRDEQALREAFGQINVGVAFHGLLDPGGKAMVLSSCQGTMCSLLGVVDGRPVVPLAQPDDEPFARIFSPSASAVWHDETFYMAANTGPQIHLWKTDAGRPRLLARIPRVTTFNNQSSMVTLVRRAQGGPLGLLSLGASVSGQSEQDLFVLPVDPATGQAGELLHLGSAELSWANARVCSPEDNGWLITISPSTYPSLKLPPGVRLGEIELRARVEPTSICLEAGAARLLDQGPPDKQARPRPGPAPAGGFPVLATSGARRVTLVCRP